MVVGSAHAGRLDVRCAGWRVGAISNTNFKRPLFADQPGMQETEHSMDTEPVEQDDVPPPLLQSAWDAGGEALRGHALDVHEK